MGMPNNPPGYVLNPVSNEWEKVYDPNSAIGILKSIANTGPQASTYLGAGMSTAGLLTAVSSVLPPTVGDLAAQGAGVAVEALMGNLPGAILGGITFISGVFGMYRNEAQSTNEGITNEKIKAAVLAMSDDDKRGLLESAYGAKTIVLSNAASSINTVTNSSVDGNTAQSTNN